jgi:hypothetical protein
VYDLASFALGMILTSVGSSVSRCYRGMMAVASLSKVLSFVGGDLCGRRLTERILGDLWECLGFRLCMWIMVLRRLTEVRVSWVTEVSLFLIGRLW